MVFLRGHSIGDDKHCGPHRLVTLVLILLLQEHIVDISYKSS
jgi:hypothetical protein